MSLKIEYISIMAQAQKMLGISGVERFTGFVGQMAQMDPSVLDKIKSDKIIDSYGDMTSVPTSILRTDEEVQAMRDQRANAQAQQQKMQQMQMAASAAKDLGQTSTAPDTALGSILGQGVI